jgi:hypothetical protein
MIRSRPGFQTQRIEDQTQPAPPTKLNHDMLPALARRTAAKPGASKSPLTQGAPANATPPLVDPNALQASADAAWARMQEEAKAIAAKIGPELILNPNPSETPIMTSPHK